MFHYTDDVGFKAITSQVTWTFKAFDPLGPHPAGAYFTTLPPRANRLAARLRVPKHKREWLLAFSGTAGLLPIDEGRGRGEYIFYSPVDYGVGRDRQLYDGRAAAFPQEAA
jgi:hypothetical protein